MELAVLRTQRGVAHKVTLTKSFDLRKKLIEIERLRFPSGVAVAAPELFDGWLTALGTVETVLA